VEGLLREQLNKRKPDDEFTDINLGYFGLDGNLNIVFCPESRNAAAVVEVLTMIGVPEATPI
jgi:ATP-dependent Lon protease